MSGQVDWADHAGRSSAASAYRRFEFHKNGIVFISTHNKALDLLALRIGNENCSPARIHGGMTAVAASLVCAVLAILDDWSRYGLAQFKLRAHFLDLRHLQICLRSAISLLTMRFW